MTYVRKDRKACINDIGKKIFNFDFEEEKIKYQYFSGIKMSRQNWDKMQKYEKSRSYYEWKRAIEKKHKEKTRKQLKEFEHYLDNRINTISPQKDINGILCSVALATVATVFVNYADKINIIVEKNNLMITLIVAIILSIIILLPILWVVTSVILPIWTTSLEITFLKEYQKVIKEMLKR